MLLIKLRYENYIIISSIIAISFIGVICLIFGFISNSSISSKNFGYTIMSTSTQSDNKISSRYKKFNGQKTFDLTIKETEVQKTLLHLYINIDQIPSLRYLFSWKGFNIIFSLFFLSKETIKLYQSLKD